MPLQSPLDFTHHAGPGTAPILRGYQSEANDKCNALLNSVRAVCLVAPTGSGKTVQAAALIQSWSEHRVLFVAPRRELITQTCNKLNDVGVAHGVILAGDKKRLNLYRQVQVASADTLQSRMVRSQRLTLAPFTRIIIDEAHIGLTAKRDLLLSLWPDAKIVGLTATPCRADGKAMGRTYDEIVEVTSTAALTEAGFLVPARYYSVSEPDLKRVRTTAGDFNRADLDLVMNQPQLVGNIVQHWLEHAPARRSVVFATTIAHSAALAQEFITHGVAAEHVDANTPTKEREATFERYASGRTQVLCNVTLASTGFDLPELDCVVFARPTKSLGLYLQMLGRGLRTHPGKADCLVLDHAGNVHRHGFATDARYWTLHGKYAEDQQKKAAAERQAKPNEPRQLTCPQCKCIWGGSRQCPSCGYVFPPRTKEMLSLEGKLVELRPDSFGLTQDQWTDARRCDFYMQLLSLGDMKQYKPGWAGNQYKAKFGDYPPRNWQSVYERHPEPPEPSLETLRWVKSQNIKWRYSQKYARGTVLQ